MMIGEKHERVVIDGDDLIRPYAVRPAVRPVVEFDVYPNWVRGAAIVAAIPLALLMIAFALHALMPTVN